MTITMTITMTIDEIAAEYRACAQGACQNEDVKGRLILGQAYMRPSP